jgi:hypothetical protein
LSGATKVTTINESPEGAQSNDKAEAITNGEFQFLRKPPRIIDAKAVSNEVIHQNCMFALMQCIEHGNTGFAIQLLEKLGNRHQLKRKIAAWFCRFGRFGIDRYGRLVYRKKKCVTKKNIDECLRAANRVPFYSDQLGPVNIARLTTTPIPKIKATFGREKDGFSSSSLWAVSGGLPTLGKRR